MYYLCKTHYKPITVQCYIANCVRYVCWTYQQIGLKEQAFRTEFICMTETYCIVFPMWWALF